MSLSKEAIQLLQQQESCKRNLITEYDLQSAVTLVPEGVQVVNLEKYQKTPGRHRSIFKTDNIDSFARYCDSMVLNDESIIVFSSSETLDATVIFDLSTRLKPTHNEVQIRLKADWSEEWRSIDNFTRSDLSQKHLAELIEEWRDLIVPIDNNRDPIALPAAIAAIRNIETNMKTGSTNYQSDLNGERSAIEQIEIKEREGKLPWGLVFNVSPTEKLPKQERILRMNIKASEKPSLSFRELRPKKSIEQAVMNFTDTIDNVLDEYAVAHDCLIGELF